LKDASAASLQFQNVLNNRGVAPQSQFYAMAHLGRARAATLLGQTDEARNAYETLLTLWKDADPALQPVKDARAELTRRR
jgi:hypothetical protein